MKLTKKLEVEILKVYNTVWDAYLRGDMRTFASTLDENCYIIGSAAGEVFKNKKAAVKYYKSTAEQITGKAEFRNRKIKVMPVEKGFMVNEEADFYLLIDDQWTFYGPARISSLFHKKNNKWKVIHQHGSFPDSKTEEGEQVNTDKIKAENVQLRDAVKRRTEELENKNHELEIETSLEKVRAVAMGMRKPQDFPNVCEVLFKELQSLGFKELRNAMVNIHNDEKRSFVNYDYSDEIGKSITPLTYNEHPVIKKQVKQIRKADDAFSETVFKGKDLEDWKTFRKSRGEKNDKRIKNISALYYYFYSIGTGSIGISTFNAISKEQRELLKRFRNVFAFAYRRYMDVAQAEAQAKEARIELALERVRARAMAMHNSDELAELVATVFNELTHLDFKLTSCIIWIHDHEKALDTLWIASAEMNKPAKPFQVTPFHKGFFGSIVHAWKAKDPKWIYAFTGAEKKNFEKAFFKELPHLPDALKKALNVPKQVVFSASFNNFGGLEIVETEPLTDEKFEILHRFGKVFDSSYTRFNDLKKAEAQAREAQIEAALEKVRGRAMAMHKSEELLEAGALLYSELSKLGIEKLTSGYMLIDEDEKMGWNYGVNPSNGQIIPKPVGVPLTETKEIRTILESWKKQEPIHVKHLDPRETIVHQSYMADHAVNFPITKEKLLSITPERLVIHTFNFKHGYLIIVRGEELAAEQQEMVVRFAKVFEMTYRRFLDLQKAEAQVREAQIETALERVRSKTMAMHKSEEVTGIAVSLNEELLKLGFDGGSTIMIIDKETGDTEQWTGFSEDKNLKSCYVPYFKHPCHDAQLDAWKRGEKFLVYTLAGKEKKTLDEHYFATGYKDFPESDKKWMREMRSVTFSHAFMKYGAIHWGPNHLTEEQLKILQRFSKVFEQSYTRFLDLQKAEAQAREAQIEAALERVRSRSMAMHKSDDLHEVIKVVVEQLSVLSVKFNVSNFAKIGTDGSWDLWLSTPDQTYPALIHVPYIDHPIFSRITEEGTKRNDFFTDVYSRKEANIFFHHFFENTIAKNTPEERKQFVYNSKGFARSIFLTKNIWFSVSRYDITPFTDEENAIFKRFANVFEQAYTRFLDLQKAEAQARETEIELSLERVRAKTMAMQKPSEFVDVINIIGEQFIHLGFDIDWANFGANGFAISEGIDIWNFAVIPGGSPIAARVFIPYFDHPVFTTSAASINEFTNGGKDFTVVTLDKQTKDTWLDHLFTKTIFKDVPEEYRAIQYAKPGYTTSNISLKDTWLSIGKFDIKNFTDEQQAILRRFANAFGQAYTRFLDLQNAEAQAKEAQIEAALERVRARSMAMHHSSELHAAADVLFQQLRIFGGDIMNAGIALCKQDADEDEYWLSSDSGLRPVISIPHTEDSVQKKLYEDWKNKSEFFSIAKGGDELKAHYNYMQSVPSLKPFFKEGPDWSFPTWQKWHAAYFSHGYLFMITLKPYEEEKILVRFAKVFEQAYTRFLDLQKAEAQAREAQIEAGLERVRSRAMAMQSSEQLRELIGTVFTELTKLDIVLTRCLIMIYDPKSNDSVWWMANSEAPTQPIGLKVQYHEHPSYLAYVNAWKQKELKWTYTLEGNTKKEWDDFLFVETELSHLPDFVIAGMKAPDRVYLNASFNSFGNLTLATLEPLSDEHFDIMLRFAKVFDLTYTRFNDLKQAEAQAREARIETALERVRAVAMAMRKPEDLMQISEIIYKQLQALDFANLRNVQIAIDDDEKKTYNGVEYSEFYQNRFKQVPYDSSPMFAEIAKEIKRSNNAFYQKEISGKEFEDWRIWRTNIKEREDSHIHPGLAAATSMCFYLHSVGTGMLGISTFNPIEDEQLDILKRFKNVFELSYRRYIDIEKAEAQAREAQIELALERVRARTMAMHRSEELAETAQVLFQQLSELGGMPDRISIGIVDEINAIVNFWSTDQSGTQINQSFKARLNEPTTISKIYEAWKAHQRSLTIDLQGDELKNWIQYAREEMGIVVKDDHFKNRRVHHVAFFSHGWILVTTHEPQSAETLQILERFASVFNLTYRRFLDLQKAEAQANEARIEIALERIRARALAMHKSDELMEVANVLREQMALLGQPELESSVVHLYEEDLDHILSWRSFKAKDPNSKIGYGHMAIPKNCCEVVREWLTKFYSDLKEYTIEISGAKQEEWYEILFKLAPDVVNSMRQENSIHEKRYYRFSKFSGGALLMVSKQEPSEEVTYLQKRAAVVFDLAYRRFSDLQKAEAQARESQIETALEKVRSRSLAMHKSDELQEVVDTVFERLQDLNIEMASANIAIFKEGTRNYDYWIASPAQKRSASFHMPYTALSLTRDLIAARESGKEFSTSAYSFEEKNEWFEYAFKDTDFKFLSEERKQFILNSPGITVAIAFSKNTGVQVNRYNSKLYSEGEGEILKRFSKVFEQAYIRFLDLEKAEAQGREAQIEAALERVRSSSLAMHKSEELKDVVKIVFENFRSLGLQNIDSVNINIFHEGSRDFDLWLAAPGQDYTTNFRLPYLDHPIANDFFNDVKKGETIHKGIYDHDLKNKYFEYMFENSDNKHLPEERKELILKGRAYSVATGIAKHSSIFIHNYNGEKFSDETNGILVKFSKVFDQAYTRFLDLQKAEAQAREAQIETVLERVRSRTMAMQKSDELTDVAGLLFEQVSALGIKTWTAGFNVWSEDNNSYVDYITSPQGGFIEPYTVYTDTAEALTDISNARKSGVEFDIQYVEGEKIKQLYLALTKLDEKQYEIMLQDGVRFPSHQYEHFVFGSKVSLMFITYEPVPEAHDIFKRLGKVFEQTYTRFLDLQKAEAQAREAQIEGSLERVRSKTMAMHNSQDVGETVAVMFDELRKLDVETLRCGVGIMLENYQMELWTARAGATGKVEFIVGNIDMKLHPLLTGGYEAWKNRAEGFFYQLKDEDLKTYFDAINSHQAYPAKYDISSLPSLMFHYEFNFNEGCLFAFSTKKFSDESSQIFKRFASVFGQTYRRYLDLQKAEAQAREALIEAGLERVRARTMAMHSSDDVSIATATMFTELEKLGIENFRGGITNIHPNRTQEVWSVNNLAEGKSVKAVGIFNMDAHPFWQQMYEEWVNKKDFVYTFLTGKEKEDYIKILNATQGYLSQTIQEFPDVHFQVYAFNEGGVWTNSLKPHTEEEKQVMKRFASVFSLTFRRYQDLQKAEAQTREATIEAALEKVRGKAMAMHNSNDLTATASLVFTELRKLGISPMRCGVGILNKENRKALLYTAIASEEGDSLSQIGWVLLDVDPVLRSIYDHWSRGEDYFPVLKKEMLRSFYEQLKSGFEVPEEQTKYEHHGYFLTFSEGVFYGWSEKPSTESELKILKRFASVIDLTFRRYIELQKSETNAREAVKQAALDRVRAEIASMRTINDLDRITPLIWNELTILGIPFIRCGVFIMDNEQQLIHTFLSTPDGKAIAAFHLPYDTPGNLNHVVANWKKNKKYIDHWDEAEFIQFADILVKGGALASAEQYLKTIPQGGFYLHFLPFLQGMLYVGNTTQLEKEEIELIQHVADAFSTAYARYEDFNKLEAAKQQVEKTLTDLKQAQTQLVQAEKMASLGELTAGIAHEIQNPLNFVNNFSEVSKELLDEMKTELEIGNTEDAKDIADDVIQNLEKINHHGKRADAIVKSMLQHSRSSSGKKEPTDINSLADEYLRLAYHGLRAKDKSFNAKFETEFDGSIGKINIISQDIGRVLVNLINNAFYAVSERKKQESNGYEPTVEVFTKKIDDKIEIKVKDNGNGIPPKVLDKIFQPFFTTKPTGQGTGLGLSLAYDIITKGHGGELKVETKEGEGSEFIIQLPNQSS